MSHVFVISRKWLFVCIGNIVLSVVLAVGLPAGGAFPVDASAPAWVCPIIWVAVYSFLSFLFVFSVYLLFLYPRYRLAVFSDTIEERGLFKRTELHLSGITKAILRGLPDTDQASLVLATGAGKISVNNILLNRTNEKRTPVQEVLSVLPAEWQTELGEPPNQRIQATK